MDDFHELRSQLIAALMTAEDYDYEDAERIVGEFERSVICPRCGAEIGGERGEFVLPPNQITRQKGTWGATLIRPVYPISDD